MYIFNQLLSRSDKNVLNRQFLYKKGKRKNLETVMISRIRGAQARNRTRDTGIIKRQFLQLVAITSS